MEIKNRFTGKLIKTKQYENKSRNFKRVGNN